MNAIRSSFSFQCSLPLPLRTTGILQGRQHDDGSYHVERLLLPHQVGTSDSCEATVTGDVQMVSGGSTGLTALGWVHTRARRRRCSNSCVAVAWHLIGT